MATYISRTPSSAGNRKKFTISMWVKRGGLGIDHWLVQGGTSGTEFDIRFNTSDQIRFSEYASSTGYGLITNRKFRDTAAWYHLVFTYDSAQSTDTDRNKIYVNGEQILASDCTAYDSGKHPPQNHDNAAWNNTTEFRINDVTWTSSSAKDAIYTHIHHTDGYAYAASDFGETDSTSGIWKPKTGPSVTYGTNGFFLKFADSSNLDLDSSGNNLTFATSGTLTQNVDTPNNNFATLNKLSTHGNNSLTNGSLTIGFNANTSYTNCLGNMGVSSGRWYAECKLAGVSTYYPALGIASMGNNTYRYNDPLYTGAHLGADEGSAYFKHGNIQAAGSTVGNYASFTTGDIIGMYLDLESGTKTMKYYKNDSLIVSFTITPVDGQFYTFGATGTSSSDIANFNFGQGFFGTTAVSSSNADANGEGLFEYNPTLSGVNYYALCTNNIKEFG